MQLLVENTFLHVRDMEVEGVKLPRSQSDCLSDSSSAQSYSCSGDSDVSGPYFCTISDAPSRSNVPKNDQSSGRPQLQPGKTKPAASSTASHSGLQSSASASSDKAPATRTGGDHTDNPLWCIGSELHYLGQCHPCQWYWTKGCREGRKCTWCHICPKGTIRLRHKERKRLGFPSSKEPSNSLSQPSGYTVSPVGQSDQCAPQQSNQLPTAQTYASHSRSAGLPVPSAVQSDRFELPQPKSRRSKESCFSL